MIKNGLRRRTFLQAVSVGSVAALAAPRRARAGQPSQRVVILGAGLAGLSAAYELLKADPGLEVILLEARDRVGGRVHTVRTHDDAGLIPFANGQYAEAGAQRIPETHDRTLGYVNELGLGGSLVEFSKGLGGGAKGKMGYLLKGHFFFYDGVAWPSFLDLTSQERNNAFFPQSIQHEFRWVTGPRPSHGTNHLGNPAVPFGGAANWPYGDGIASTLDEWNGYSLSEFLASRGASHDWIHHLYTAENGSEHASTASLAWLVQSALDYDWGTTYYLNGGLDQIPGALADAVTGLGGVIHHGAAVFAIEQSAAGVTVSFVNASGAQQSVTAARVVCSLPFPVLRDKVNLTQAGIASDKLGWIQTMEMMSASRACLQTNTRFWRNHGIEGLKLVGTDTEVERLWHSTNTQPGATGLLQTYMQQDNAEALGAVAAGDRMEHMVERISSLVFPEMESQWNGLGFQKVWKEDPWTGGAWASPKRHQFLQGFPVWGRAEGRIHFAGEHTSLYSGWMQGGIESGQRAAYEILSVI
jgi:monoamine oxidase